MSGGTGVPSARPVHAEPDAVGPRRRRAGGPQFRQLAGEKVAEGGTKVTVEQRVDARVDTGRQVPEPREHGEQVRRHVTRAVKDGSWWHVTRTVVAAARAVREVGAEERQPERDERREHPDERLLGATLARVDLRRAAARRQHVEVDERLGTRPAAVHERRRRRLCVSRGRMSVTLTAD